MSDDRDAPNESIMECLGNPLKARIMILMKEYGPLTPKQIMEKDPRMPQATVYRALKSMEDCHVLQIVAETKVKAMVEKTYSFNEELPSKIKEMISTNDGDSYFRLFAAFAFNLMRSFEEYSKNDSIDIKRDGSGFFSMPIYATAEELEELRKELHGIMAPYFEQRSEDQELHTMGFVVTPPKKTE